MTAWQPGAHQPDRVAAAVIAFDVLADAARQTWSIAAPVGATAPGGGFGARPGSRRPGVDALMAESAARKRAQAAGTDPDDEPEAQAAQRVVSMAGYLSRRADGGGCEPLRPLSGLRSARRRN